MHFQKIIQIARAGNFFETNIFEFRFGISVPKDIMMAGGEIGLLKNGDHNPPYPTVIYLKEKNTSKRE